jgi:hypothetical protein
MIKNYFLFIIYNIKINQEFIIFFFNKMEINIFIFIININCLISILKINRKEIDPKLFTSDDDYLYYFYQLYLSPAPTEEFIPIIKDYFTLKGNETMIYIFSDMQYLTQFFYTSILSIYDNKIHV